MSSYYPPGGGPYGGGGGRGRGGYGAPGMMPSSHPMQGRGGGGGHPMGMGMGQHQQGHMRGAQAYDSRYDYDMGMGGGVNSASLGHGQPRLPQAVAPIPHVDHHQQMPVPGAAPPGPVPAPVPPGASAGTPAGGVNPKANDCEIIVTAKAQQTYAEMIEKAIKEFKLKVDIMFPKPDVKLAQFIENIAQMGTIFAVVIRPDNEAHRSVSVHVLRGSPKAEEHRNMPLTAAYQLIRERYLDIKRKEIGAVPDNLKPVLRRLLEEQPINDRDYPQLIRFLQERRRKQRAFENRTNNTVGGNEDDTLDTPEAEELKQKILGILTGKNVAVKKEGELGPDAARNALNNSDLQGHSSSAPGPGPGRGGGVGRW